jgi:hypothetical protein
VLPLVVLVAAVLPVSAQDQVANPDNKRLGTTTTRIDGEVVISPTVELVSDKKGN